MPKKWDKVFYYRDETAVYKASKYQQFFTDEYHQVMDFIIPYLDKKLAAYYTHTAPQLLHADLNPYNIWTHQNTLRVIDF